MKSSPLIICLILLFFFQPYGCKAQYINKKIGLYAHYVTAAFHGKDLIEENEFRYPSFYSNLKNTSGISLKFISLNRQYLSWGLDMTLLQASNWEYSEQLEYKRAAVKLKSISPLIQLHNKFSDFGIFNKLKFFAEAGPVGGIATISSSKFQFDIQRANDPIELPTKKSDYFYGIKGATGMEWAISPSAGLVVSYALQHNWVSSILYTDTNFTSSLLHIGLILKLNKDKHFIYR